MELCMEMGKKQQEHLNFKSGKYKVKGNFVNGLPDGLFEKILFRWKYHGKRYL